MYRLRTTTSYPTQSPWSARTAESESEHLDNSLTSLSGALTGPYGTPLLQRLRCVIARSTCPVNNERISQVGDYGTIDEESGLFKTHGNIFRNQLLPEAMAGNLPVRTDTPDDEVVVLHSGRKESELPPPVADKLGPAVYKVASMLDSLASCVTADALFRPASILVVRLGLYWPFTESVVYVIRTLLDFLLLMDGIQTSLPIAFDLDTVLSLKELTGMYLITSILKCPSYCIYLSNGGMSGFNRVFVSRSFITGR